MAPPPSSTHHCLHGHNQLHGKWDPAPSIPSVLVFLSAAFLLFFLYARCCISGAVPCANIFACRSITGSPFACIIAKVDRSFHLACCGLLSLRISLLFLTWHSLKSLSLLKLTFTPAFAGASLEDCPNLTPPSPEKLAAGSLVVVITFLVPRSTDAKKSSPDCT